MLYKCCKTFYVRELIYFGPVFLCDERVFSVDELIFATPGFSNILAAKKYDKLQPYNFRPRRNTDR